MPIERRTFAQTPSWPYPSGGPPEHARAMASAPETNAVPGVPPDVLVAALPRAPKRPPARSAPANPAAKTPAIARAALARHDLSAWATVDGPARQQQRWNAAYAVLRCLDEMNDKKLKKSSEVLDLTGLQLDELPPVVKTLSHLRTLTLSGNVLSAPPDLSGLPHLQTLALGANRLAAAPDLRAQTGLKELNLVQNHIAIPPVLAQSRLLERVRLGSNQMVAMPDVRGLIHLKELDLRNNALRTVPDWIADLPAGLTIDLQGNPLSAATIAFLHELSEKGKGPHILFSRECTESDTPASLASEIEFWLRPSPRTSPWPSEALLALRSRWEDFEREPDAGSFALLLNKLDDTADFQSSDATRHALLRQMPDVLAALAREKVLRARCFELAADGVGACEDRVALTFSRIQTAVLASACAGDWSKLLTVARAEFRLAHLDEIARNDKKALNGGTEEVEVVLAYRCHLGRKLELPCQPQEMFYGHVTRIDATQLENAEHAVRSAEAMPGALARFAAAQPFWRESLDAYPPFAEAVDVPRNVLLNRLEMLRQESSTLTTGKYLEREAEIKASYAKELDELYERMTADIIQRHSLPPAPDGPTP